MGGSAIDEGVAAPANRLWLAALLLVFAAVVVNSAWISDDAYITLRTVDNFVHGYGLRWNVVERVQSYTHPLWMVLLSFSYFITREAAVTTVVLSVAVSAIAAALLIFKIGAGRLWPAALGVSLLITSKAFIDYSTSGLENPATHLFAAWFFWVHFDADERKPLRRLALIAALSACNRMDSVLLYVPALLYDGSLVRKTEGTSKCLRDLGLGFTPLIAWEIFSVVYYGFPFPNTAYAKLDTGIPVAELATQGWFYLFNSLTHDCLTLATLLAALGLVASKPQPREGTAVLGAWGYVWYVVGIGGDFMSGRFLSAPFFVAVIVLVRAARSSMRPSYGLAASVPIALIVVLNPSNPLRTGRDYSNPRIDAHGIADERGFYYQGTGLLARSTTGSFFELNRSIGRSLAEISGEQPVNRTRMAGIIGYYAGPSVYLIDELALSDPLLARIPPRLRKGWRIGHLHRELPDGYVETRRSGTNVIADPDIAELYDSLAQVTQAPLFSTARWRAIWQLNLSPPYAGSRQAMAP